MQIEHFILANNSSIDINTNSLSVFGILDDMQIQAPPGATLNLSFHAILIVKRETKLGAIHSSFTMSVTAPNGTKIGQEIKMPVEMQAVHRRSRLRVIAEIPISQSGVYRVRMVNSENPNISGEASLNIQILPVAVPPPSSQFTQ